jgi:hypothetical protein
VWRSLSANEAESLPCSKAHIMIRGYICYVAIPFSRVILILLYSTSLSFIVLNNYITIIMSELPPYMPKAVKPSMAGPIQTCSIQDMQHDYFRITENSPSNYEISLTTNPTPLYRITVSRNASATTEIQIFQAFSSEPAVATCRIPPKRTKGAIVTMCIAQLLPTSAPWLEMIISAYSTRECYGLLPIVKIPGCKPVLMNFAWRFHQGFDKADLELWLESPLPYAPVEGHDYRQLFASYYKRGTKHIEKNVLEIRRGGGLQFEYVTLLGIFAVLEMKQ